MSAPGTGTPTLMDIGLGFAIFAGVCVLGIVLALAFNPHRSQEQRDEQRFRDPPVA